MPLPSERDTKLWLALLHEIDSAGGAAKPRDIYAKLAAHFSDITQSDLARENKSGGSTWTNRVQWVRQHLLERKCLLNTPGVWTLTDIGRQWLETNWKGPLADYSQVPKPALSSNAPPGAMPADRGLAAGPKKMLPASTVVGPLSAPTPAPGPILVVTDPTEKLCTLLRTTQRLSGAPQNFEQALAEAFAALGFEARHIGGSGETDIFVSARLGALSYSAVLDAKSTQSGKVPDAQINWPVIDAHRQGRTATYAAVIGEEFSGGQLQKFADQYNVTLLTTGMLCEVLRLHATTPLTLLELRDLFSIHGRADQAVHALRQRNAQQLRHWHLIAEIVDSMEVFEAKLPGGFAPTVDQLHFLLTTQSVTLGQPATNMPSRQDVADAVSYLSSRAVQVLAEVQGSNGHYQLAMSSATARKHMLALARLLDETAHTATQVSALSAQMGPATT